VKNEVIIHQSLNKRKIFIVPFIELIKIIDFSEASSQRAPNVYITLMEFIKPRDNVCASFASDLLKIFVLLIFFFIYLYNMYIVI